jgi:hypothetical protein
LEVTITTGGLGGDRSQLGHGDAEIGEHLQQEGLELVVGAIDLVDEEHRPLTGPDRVQQRPLDQELGSVQFRDVLAHLAGLQGPGIEQLARVVPLVERLRGVDAFVALEPDQLRVEQPGERLAYFRLADPGLTLQEQGPLQLECEEDRRGEARVGEVRLRLERALDLLYRSEVHPVIVGRAERRASILARRDDCDPRREAGHVPREVRVFRAQHGRRGARRAGALRRG